MPASKYVPLLFLIALSDSLTAQPLHSSQWDVQIQGGVVPIIWSHRKTDLENYTSFPVSFPVFRLLNSPRFDALFGTPWTIGGQVGYAWSDHFRLYGEVNYVQASGVDEKTLKTASSPYATTHIALHDYRLVDAYAGLRYYVNCWQCQELSSFFGVKLGLTHHYTTAMEALIPIASTTVLNLPFFQSNTSIAGGVNLGFDYAFCQHCSLVLTGEFVFSQAPHILDKIVLPSPLFGYNALSIGRVGTEIRFPVTAAFRYKF